jgi:hypothetical protein
MGKKSTQSRRQRRMELRRANFLKIKNMYSRFSEPAQAWYSKMQEDGKAAHEAHEKRVMDSIEEQLETKLKGLRSTWAELGYDSKEVEMLEEAWTLTAVKDKDRVQFRADKKRARELRREANKLRTARA